VVVTTEAWAGHRLARPFLGTGVLGGYTTFSAYTLEIRGLAGSGHVAAAAVYLFATLFLALAAVQAGMSLTRWATRAHRTERSSR
jgi:CrcB protein